MLRILMRNFSEGRRKSKTIAKSDIFGCSSCPQYFASINAKYLKKRL